MVEAQLALLRELKVEHLALIIGTSMGCRQACDYDPQPKLAQIEARIVAINTADDLINPPELAILEREIKQVRRGRAIVIPISKQTRGHGTHTLPAFWKEHLAELLNAH